MQKLVILSASAMASQESPGSSSDTPLAIACTVPGVQPLDRYKTECFFAQNQLDIFVNQGNFALTDEECQLIHQDHETTDDIMIENFFTDFTLQEGCQMFLQETLPGDRGGRRRDRNRNPNSEEQEEPANPLEITNYYGCFCSFGLNMDFGKGKPQNDLDRICRTSYHNYQCMKETNPSCVNFDTYYIATVKKDQWEIETDCDLFNGALQARYEWTDEELECARSRCRIDSEFTISALGLAFTDGYQFDTSYKWPEQGGTFDRETVCRASGGSDRLDGSVCCGSYPDRAPRDINVWACCGTDINSDGNPYKPAFEDCCTETGTVVDIGGFC